MLVSEVIERTYNEWLYPSGVNRPSYDKLAAAITDTQLSFFLTGRVKNVPADSVIEIDSEQLLVESVSAAFEVTVTPNGRGWLETGAVAHAMDAIVWVDPTFTRRSIFNALISVMGLLYPAGVYARLFDTTTTYSNADPTKTLPTGGKRVISIIVDRGTTIEEWNPLRPGVDFEEMLEFVPPKYALRFGGKEGGAMRVVYAADFTIPTSEADELNTLAAPIPTTLQPYLPMAIAGHLLRSREVPRVQIEEIRRRLAAEGIQVGSALNVGDALLNTFMARYVAAERDRLNETDSIGMEFSRR